MRSGLASITPAEAIDVALCWGWIDGIRKGFDEQTETRTSPTTSPSLPTARKAEETNGDYAAA